MCFTSCSILYNCNFQATDNVKYFSYVIVTCIQSTIFFSFMKKYSIPFHVFIQKYLLDNDFLLNIYFQNAVISCASSRSPCFFFVFISKTVYMSIIPCLKFIFCASYIVFCCVCCFQFCLIYNCLPAAFSSQRTFILFPTVTISLFGGFFFAVQNF